VPHRSPPPEDAIALPEPWAAGTAERALGDFSLSPKEVEPLD
jgi:hypothetical protein